MNAFKLLTVDWSKWCDELCEAGIALKIFILFNLNMTLKRDFLYW